MSRGTLYFSNEKYNEAIDDYYEVIKIDETNSLAYNNIGVAY
jgi:hypothetical protein